MTCLIRLAALVVSGCVRSFCSVVWWWWLDLICFFRFDLAGLCLCICLLFVWIGGGVCLAFGVVVVLIFVWWVDFGVLGCLCCCLRFVVLASCL